MNTPNNNVIQISTKFVTANIATPETSFVASADASVNEAISELRDLWSATNGLVRSSRDSLYEFLGVTYKLAKQYGADDGVARDLRASVQALYVSDAQKKPVAKKSIEELLLASAMGIAQASLRSKYKRILLNATGAGIAPDLDSFKVWLGRTGGIVNALADAVLATELTSAKAKTPESSAKSQEADLIANRPLMEKEDRTFVNQYRGFTVVLYHTDPNTKETFRLAVIAERGVVEGAIKAAHKELTPAVQIEIAA
jgi:hypothetical protein